MVTTTDLTIALKQSWYDKLTALAAKQGKAPADVAMAILEAHLKGPEDKSILARLWNLNRGPLPAVLVMTETRRKSALDRWREKPDEQYWTSVIKRMAKSGFCRGGNRSSWVADFDFLIKPDRHHFVMEGRYDDRKQWQPDDLPPQKGIAEILKERGLE